MPQLKTTNATFSLFFLFLVAFVVADFNILIDFFLRHIHLSDTLHLIVGAVTVILTLLLIFSLFSRCRILEKRIKKEWEQTINTMTDYVSVHDKKFKILKVNNALCDFLHKKPEEIIGKYCYQVFHNTEKPIAGCPHEKSIKTNHAVTMEINDSGIGVPLQVTCSPFYNEKNEFQGSFHIARSITGRSTKQIKSPPDKPLVSICASCKNIRNQDNIWERVEEYFQKHCRVTFTHCICNKCQKNLYPEFIEK